MHSSTDVIAPLRELDSGIAKSATDLRGWTVISAGASRLPAYTGGPVTPELATAVRRWFERGFVPG
jgi:hypothetical protein